MARLRLNPLNPEEKNFPHDKNETIQKIFDRFWNSLKINDERIKGQYVVLLNGEIIDKELWETVVPGDSDVLISINLMGGNFRSIARSLIVLTAVIVASYASAGLGSAASGGIAAAAGLGATLLTNALLPPINAGFNSSSFYDDTSSQVYTLSNQSNTIKKFQNVPKVYGTHRLFPSIVASPYVEVEADPSTGKLVQYYYCIYDFGLGPCQVSQLKIGDTPISEFFQAHYRFVDPNRPDADEGIWDTYLNKEFTYYRGKSNQDTFSINLNKNLSDVGSIPSEYQAVRSADENTLGRPQHISLVIAFPSGLTTYGTNGARAARAVEFDIEFAEVGTENWRSYSDSNYSYTWESTGNVEEPQNILLLEDGLTTILLQSYYAIDPAGEIGKYLEYTVEQKGIVKGTSTFNYSGYLNINTYLRKGSDRIGKIKTRTPIVGGYQYELYEPFPYTIDALFKWTYYNPVTGLPTSTYVSAYNNLFNNLDIGSVTTVQETTKATYLTVKFQPKTTNSIKVRVTRNRSYGGYTYQIIDSAAWTGLLTRFDVATIFSEKRHTFLEVRIKATDQLNGTLQNLSGVVTSVLDVWNGSSWTKELSSNPAWIFADLLTGEVNKRAIDKSKLDTTSLLEWADYSDEYPSKYGGGTFDKKRYECNFVLDYTTTLYLILNKVANSCGAGLNISGGLYGVLIDQKKFVPVQVFTPRNSSSFSSSRTYVDLPHGLKVKYIDSLTDWNAKEVIAYQDGYDANNAETFEEMETFGCTNNEQAWRYGRYMLAQGKLRQENIRIEVDFENLVCLRGDYVLFQHDVMKVGGTPARVKAVAGSVITINDSFTGTIGGTYGYTFRGVSEIYTGTMTLNSSDTSTVNGTVPSVGDLIVWGEVSQVTINAIVKAIEPGQDLTATLHLVERANEIHDAGSGAPIPDYDPQITTASIGQPPNEVSELTATQGWQCSGGGYEYFIDLTWIAPTNTVVETYEIYVQNENVFTIYGYSSTESFRFIVDGNNLNFEHSFKVLGVDANGVKLSIGSVTAISETPLPKTTSPSNVEALYINVLDQTLQLNWMEIPDCDVSYYLIRYSPSDSASWFSSIPLQTVKAGTTMTSVSARVGSYHIKAIDWNGNESDDAALAITSIPGLVNLNLIEETNDFPDLLGNKVQVVGTNGELKLQELASGGGGGVTEYYSEGFYYYKELLDLGDIYTVRLQALVEAEGFSDDDLMSSWTTLSDVTAMQTSTVSDWDVEAQFRSTNEFITMDTWPDLTSVTALDSGSAEVWTEWKAFTAGDFTARIFQFRLRLISHKPSVSPRVFDGIIKSDYPDRTESYNNITVPVTGYNVTYTPSFAGPGTTPMIQVTQDAASQGDYFLITNKTLEGFTIKFYDKTDTLVERQADFFIRGYGRKNSSVIG